MKLMKNVFNDPIPYTSNTYFDAMNRVEKYQDPFGNETQYTRDRKGRLTSRTLKRNTGTLAAPNLIDYQQTQYDYDFDGHIIQQQQKSSNATGESTITLNTYTNNRLTQTQTYSNADPTRIYETNTTYYTDAKGNITTYSYDLLSRVTQIKQPLGQTENYLYDNRDRLTQLINANNQKIQYSYNAWGPLNQINYYANTTTTTAERNAQYSYDVSGNITSIIDNHLIPTAQYSFQYDALNRLSQQVANYLPTPVTLNYAYDNIGNRQSLTLIDSQTFSHNYTYNLLNQLTQAVLNNQTYNFAYFNNDTLKTILYPNTVSTTNTYKNNGPLNSTQLKNSSNATIGGHVYTYDVNDNILTQQTSIGTQTYKYDGLNRLITATHAAAFALPNENYQYDGVGNRTQNNSVANLYDNNNRITKIGATVITHNAAGSLTQNGASAYTYNSEQRLTQTVKSGVTTLYKYDAFGRRVAKNSSGVTTFYVWDNENLISEYNTAGQRTKRYAYIPNRYAALQLEDANGIYQVHTNHLDTPTQLTDSAQKIVWQANYQAFGNTNINQDPDANGIAIIYNQRFPGQYQDVETNLYYNFYRDYDPSTGRYLQSDPIGLGGGINVYGYVSGNPLKWIDVLGLYCVTCTANGPTGKAPDTGQNYDGSGRKWCTYNCQRDDNGDQKDVNGPGHGEFCIGQSGGDDRSPKVNFDTFTHDTDSRLDRAPLGPITNGPDFNQAIHDTFGEK